MLFNLLTRFEPQGLRVLRSKFSARIALERIHPLRFSLGLHAVAILAVMTAFYWDRLTYLLEPVDDVIDFEVIDAPVVAPQPLRKITETKRQESQPQNRRQVFGASPKNLLANPEEGERVKAGNTVAKTPDSKALRPGDEEPLPIPVEEYLVSNMPRVKNEVRARYPSEARAQGIEGVVVLKVLVDARGRVRRAEIVSGPGFGLNEAALAAIRDFEFAPAEVDGEPVAVEIRYAYRFKKEDA